MAALREIDLGRQEVDNKMFLLALRWIGFEGSDKEIMRQATEVGTLLLAELETGDVGRILIRAEGFGPKPDSFAIGAIGGCEPVEFVARLAAVAIRADGPMGSVEIGFIRGGQVDFPVYSLNNGKLKRSGRLAKAVASVRQFGAR